MFVCTKCGICCKNIKNIPELAVFDKGNGICVYLSKDNLCMIYKNRPDICNTEKMYEKKYKYIISREQFDSMNMYGCYKMKLL